MSTKSIIRQVAKNNGVSTKEVKRNLQDAIKKGASSLDPNVQILWKEIAPKSKEPSIDELLHFCIKKVLLQNLYNLM